MANNGGEVQEYLYKILVVGDIGTGKTSIIKRYVHNIFSNSYKSTVSVPAGQLYNSLNNGLTTKS